MNNSEKNLGRRELPLVAGAVLGGGALLGAPAAFADGGVEVLSESEAKSASVESLDRMQVPGVTSADGPIWSPVATGYASVRTEELPFGTVGGVGGRIVTAWDAAALERYAGAAEPLVILVPRAIEIEPLGAMIDVASHKSILGVGRRGEIVGGGLRLLEKRNVVIRNLTFRDSYLPGDWDGKDDDNDNDGIRIDTSTHVWIDHCEFTRLGDGQVDVRKDTKNVTVSWSVFRDHNKTLGVGWTDNLITTLTVHHCWFSNTYQRNASIDNVEAAHLYNNFLEGQGHYGTMSRGAAKVLIESSVYEHGEDAVVAKDPESQVQLRDNVFTDIRGRKDETGETFDPSESYSYRVDPVDDVPQLARKYAGSRAKPERPGRQVAVSLHGDGDYASISAAVGAAWRADREVEIVIEPGTYHEIVRIWPGTDGVVLRGATGHAEDVVLTYDLAAGTEKFYGGEFGGTGAATLAILAEDVTVADMTIENAYDEDENGESQAQALRTVGDRVVLDNVRLIGNQDTYLAESPEKGQVSRTYVTSSYIEGDVDFIYGRGTVAIEDSEIHSVDRGANDGETNGYVAAPATAAGTFGILFTGCRFTSGAREGSVFLGRPWHPSSDPDVEPTAVVRDSELGAHISTPAWSDMGGFPWEEDFLREYANSGPGAASAGEDVDGRPQLTEAEAREHTLETYLEGEDDWRPWNR